MAGYGERTMLGLRQVSASQANIITGRQSLGPQRAPSKDTSHAKAGTQRQSLAAMPRASLGRNEHNSRQSIGFGSSAPRFSLGRGAGANLNKTMGGHTTMVNNRRSSIIGAERGPVKDTRPLADKKFQKHCIIEMVRYVTENNYPHPISEKIFTTFMMRDFYKIFIFLYLRLDPNYRFNVNAKTQEMGAEIQKALTLCGYPYTINKSALTTWTPTTWPHLLGIIHYLVQQAKELDAMGEPADPYSMSADDMGEDDFAEMRIIAEYTNRACAPVGHRGGGGRGSDDVGSSADLVGGQCYEEFLFGADDYPQHEALLQPFTERSQALAETIERNNEFIGEQQRLLQDMEGTLKGAQNPMVEAKTTHEGLLSDKAKFEKMIAAKKKSLAKHTAGKEEATKLLAAKLEEKQRLEETVGTMRETIKSQVFDPVQVREMNNKYAAAQERIKALQQEKAEIKNEMLQVQAEEDSQKVQCLKQLTQKMETMMDNLRRQRSEGERKLEREDVEHSDLQRKVAAWRQKVDQLKADVDIQRRVLTGWEQALVERIEKVQQEGDALEREANTLITMADEATLAKEGTTMQDRYQRELRTYREAVEYTERCLAEVFEHTVSLYTEVQKHVHKLNMEARERKRLGEGVDVDGPIPDWMAVLLVRANKTPSPPQGMCAALI